MPNNCIGCNAKVEKHDDGSASIWHYTDCPQRHDDRTLERCIPNNDDKAEELKSILTQIIGSLAYHVMSEQRAKSIMKQIDKL